MGLLFPGRPLILLGIFVLLRWLRMAAPGTYSHMMLIGDFNCAGPGELAAEGVLGVSSSMPTTI